MGPRAVEITDEIYQVGGGSLSAPQDAAIYLVSLADEAALIDCGCGEATDRLLANIEAAGVQSEDIGILLLTHCHFDHVGGAAELRRRLGCRTVAHQLDAAFIEAGDDEVTAASWYGKHLTPCPIDRKLVGTREHIVVGGRPIEAIHIPGHSPGSVAYVMESGGKRVVFAQDVHGPLHESLLSDAAAYQASLETLFGLEADILCEGHYGIFEGRGSVDAFIRRFIAT